MKKILLCAALLLGAALGRTDSSTPRMGIVKPTIGSTGWGVKWNSNADIMDSKAACLLCVNSFTQANTFGGLTTFNGASVFAGTATHNGSIIFNSTNTFNTRVRTSGGSASASLVGSETEPFAGLVGTDFCIEYDGNGGDCRTFLNAVQFTIDSIDSGTHFTISGDTQGLHTGSTIRQGTHTATVTSYDVNVPATLAVNATAGFTASTATHSDFSNPAAATASEVALALLDPLHFVPGFVTFSDSGGALEVSSGFSGSLQTMSAGEDAYAILGFTVGQQSPSTSVGDKNDTLTGFLFADDGGPGPWATWGFTDGRRWLQVDSGFTQLYGAVTLGSEATDTAEVTGSLVVDEDTNLSGNLTIGGSVGGFAVGGDDVGTGSISVVDGADVQQAVIEAIDGTEGRIQLNDDGVGSIYLSGQGGTGIFSGKGAFGQGSLGTSTLTVNGRIESLAGGFMFPDDSIQTTAAAPFAVGVEATGAADGDMFYTNGSLDVAVSSGPKFSVRPNGGAKRGLEVKAGTGGMRTFTGGLLESTGNGTHGVFAGAVGTVDAGEDTLYTITIASNTLDQGGASLEFEFSGSFAANGDNKEVRVYLSGTEIYDLGPSAFNDVDWVITGRCIRSGSTGAMCHASTIAGTTVTGVGSLDWTANEIFHITGEGSSSNDVVLNTVFLQYFPGTTAEE